MGDREMRERPAHTLTHARSQSSARRRSDSLFNYGKCTLGDDEDGRAKRACEREEPNPALT